jgi:hypothetical protein
MSYMRLIHSERRRVRLGPPRNAHPSVSSGALADGDGASGADLEGSREPGSRLGFAAGFLLHIATSTNQTSDLAESGWAEPRELED